MNMCMTKIRSNGVSKSFFSDSIDELKKGIIDRLTHGSTILAQCIKASVNNKLEAHAIIAVTVIEFDQA